MPAKVVKDHVVPLELEEMDEKDDVDKDLPRGRNILERIVRVVAMAILRGYSVEDVTKIVRKALSLKPVDKALDLLETVFSLEPCGVGVQGTRTFMEFYRERKVADVEV
ncbi:hypothetical protein [Methanopyrus sp. SNP6]|uniref:hypothetical protein n=1 Tax=Methanopyrus sp. SNP6 TaxID=1937005 RepID=UPI0011E5D119|nr:hypothetical protein [Methanopyrus sp. SNP6]